MFCNKQFLVILLTFSGVIVSIAAPIVLEHADRLETERKGNILNLFGDVSVRSGKIFIKGNEARWDKLNNGIVFFGDVLVETDENIVKSDGLFFDGKKREGQTIGESVEVRAKKNNFFARGKNGKFLEKERLSIIWTNALFTAVDSVDSEKIIIEADSLIYDSNKRLGKAYRVKKLEMLNKKDDQEILLTSDSLWSFFDGESIYCFGNVRVKKEEIKGACNILFFHQKKDIAILFGEPSVKGKNWALKGDSLIVSFDNGELKKLNLYGDNSELFFVSDTIHPDRTSSFYAREMNFHFDNGMLSKAEMLKDVYSAHYITEKETTNYGINFVKGDTSYIYLTDEKVDSVVFLGLVTGRYDRKTTPDSVFYRARTIKYYPAKEKVTLYDEGQMRYHELELQAYSISYDIGTYLLSAEGFVGDDTAYGKPVIRERGDEFLADRLSYNLKTKKGYLYYGLSSSGSAVYSGKLVSTVEGKDVYIKEGTYTTCSYNSPHYRFSSPKIKYSRANDLIIAKGVVLYIKDLPVFALPFIVFSVKKDRHSGFLPIELGNFVRGERFIRNIGYYYAPSPYWDFFLALDFDELTGWLFRSKLAYAFADYFSGSLFGSYKFESSEAITSERKKARWDFNISHSQQFSEDLRVSFSGNFVSDRGYFYDTRYTPEERMTTVLSSNLLVAKNFRQASLNISLSRQYNLEQNSITEDIPSIRFTRHEQPIISYGFLRNLTLSYSAYATRRRESHTQFDHFGSSNEMRLSFPLSYGPYFTFSPSFNFAFYFYDEDKNGNKYPFYLNWFAGATLSTRLYGRSIRVAGSWIRHVFQPVISQFFQPEKRPSAELYSFGGIYPYSAKMNYLRWSINNIFELNYKNGEKKITLTSLSLSSGYDWENRSAPLSDINATARIEPLRLLNVTLNSRLTWYENGVKLQSPRFRDISVTSNLYFYGNSNWQDKGLLSRAWRVNVYHYFAKRYSQEAKTNWIKGDISFFFTPNWRIDYSIYYDLKGVEKISENILLWRDWHCWELTIGIVPSGYRAGFYFRVNIKEIPDVKLEYGKGKVWGIF